MNLLFFLLQLGNILVETFPHCARKIILFLPKPLPAVSHPRVHLACRNCHYNGTF